MLRLSLMMIGITPEQIDSFFSAELAQAMGGLCDWAALQKKAVSRSPASPAQDLIAQAPEPLSAAAAKPRPPEVTDTELCLAQTVLFKKAYGDGFSTDRQLSDLAAATRRRFAANWIPQAELQRADVQIAAQRLWTILWRVQRLAGVGVVVPAADGGALEDIPIKEALKPLMGDEPYATIDRRLTEIEAEPRLIGEYWGVQPGQRHRRGAGRSGYRWRTGLSCGLARRCRGGHFRSCASATDGLASPAGHGLRSALTCGMRQLRNLALAPGSDLQHWYCSG